MIGLVHILEWHALISASHLVYFLICTLVIQSVRDDGSHKLSTFPFVWTTQTPWRRASKQWSLKAFCYTLSAVLSGYGYGTENQIDTGGGKVKGVCTFWYAIALPQFRVFSSLFMLVEGGKPRPLISLLVCHSFVL